MERQDDLRMWRMKAFPNTKYAEGMDLRDYFAGQVIAYLAKNYKEELAEDFDSWGDDNDIPLPNYDSLRIAQEAYAIADSMLEVRERKQ